jgi:hypothetical protein
VVSSQPHPAHTVAEKGFATFRMPHLVYYAPCIIPVMNTTRSGQQGVQDYG